MIAFACAVTKPETYAASAARGIARVAEPDSAVLERPSHGTIFQAYNALMDEAQALPDLEALVLLHQDTEIMTEGFCDEVRRALSDPDVGVVGCVGAIGVRSIAWWEGSVTCASFVHRYGEHGGGELPAFSWAWTDAPPYARMGEVDTLDGFLLVLSPAVVAELRFDEELGQLHGYDLDFCLQARASGRKVVTADFRAVHHHAIAPFTDPESWIDAHVAIAEKWAGRIPQFAEAPGTWRERALRAEAEADAADATRVSHEHVLAARREELERELADMRSSISWRLTKPLRRGAGAR
jgi:hypothetical protein